MLKNFFKLYTWSLIGVFSCYFLQAEYGLNSILASSLTGLAASLLMRNNFFDHIEAKQLIYCASFAAMSSTEIIRNYYDVVFISVLISACFHFSRSWFKGYGGRLGSIAFVAVLIFFMGQLI